MGIFSGLFRSRDKPKDSYDSPSYAYFFGRTHAGKRPQRDAEAVSRYSCGESAASLYPAGCRPCAPADVCGASESGCNRADRA